MVHGLVPHVGLRTDRAEPASGSPSPSFSAPPPLAHSPSKLDIENHVLGSAFQARRAPSSCPMTAVMLCGPLTARKASEPPRHGLSSRDFVDHFFPTSCRQGEVLREERGLPRGHTAQRWRGRGGPVYIRFRSPAVSSVRPACLQSRRPSPAFVWFTGTEGPPFEPLPAAETGSGSRPGRYRNG